MRSRSFATPFVFACLVWPVVACTSPAVHSLTIVQLNDVYEVFPVIVEVNGRPVRRGGLAHASTLVQQAKRRGPVLVLHAGDLLSPSLLSVALKHRGAQMVEALNAMGVERLRETRFRWVSANVKFPEAADLPPEKVAPFRIVNAAGLRIGVFGLTVPLRPVTGCGPEPIVFQDPVVAARAAVSGLKQRGVDLIVALTHLPMEIDRRLAETIPEIDAIVGGHDHEPLDALVGTTLITKAGANAVALGIMRLDAVRTNERWVVQKSWRREAVDPQAVAADPEVASVLAPYAKEMEPFAQVIGRTAVALDIREETIREKESNLGDYVADAMRAAMATDVALLNGGAFRDDRLIPAGSLTLGDLYTMLPFANELVVVAVTGRQLVEALENGVSMAGQKAGRFPQVSGVRFTFDPHGPVGHRVVSVSVGGQSLDPERTYTLATTEFLVRHETIDGYTLPNTVLRRGVPLNEHVIEHLKTTGPLHIETDGRITRVGEVVN